MFSAAQRSKIASIVAILLLMPAFYPSIAAARVTTSTSNTRPQQEKKEKSEKPSKDEKKNLSKQERKWLEIYRFSKQRYDTDPDFRMQVEEGYRNKQREQSEYAFSINMRDPKLAQLMANTDVQKAYLTLYDNPLAQDYVNRVGQSLVPTGSDKLYAFRILLNPIPEARSLSTGTIYVTTGLLASIDNEAQLAYVLGHEIAHVDQEHWKDDVLISEGQEAWNEKQKGKQEKLNVIRQGVGIVASQFGSGHIAQMGMGTTIFFDAAMPTVFKLAEPNAVISWDPQQEDQADEASLRYMLNRKYDPREVPKFYAKLRGFSQRDKRASLGFMASVVRIAEREPFLTSMIGPMVSAAMSGSTSRMLNVGATTLSGRQESKERETVSRQQQKKDEPGKALNPMENSAAREQGIQENIEGAHASRIKELLDAGELIGSSAEFQAVMASIRRDNGIRAFQYDMFQMARENLQESINLRSNDPYARYYYGKVLKLTARTLGEKQRALEEFALAIQLDKRKVLAEPYLYRALAMIDSRESQTREIIENLKEYVLLYQRQHGGSLPSNIDLIYDYMQDAGEMSWTAIPAMNVSTKNIDPIGVTSSSQGTSTGSVPVKDPLRPPPVTQPQGKQPTVRRP